MHFHVPTFSEPLPFDTHHVLTTDLWLHGSRRVRQSSRIPIPSADTMATRRTRPLVVANSFITRKHLQLA